VVERFDLPRLSCLRALSLGVFQTPNHHAIPD
jgi:hypothetical protein